MVLTTAAKSKARSLQNKGGSRREQLEKNQDKKRGRGRRKGRRLQIIGDFGCWKWSGPRLRNESDGIYHRDSSWGLKDNHQSPSCLPGREGRKEKGENERVRVGE